MPVNFDLFFIMSGTLYLVATPIGNLEDITLRALRILKEADVVYAEDTRRTKILLDHFGISKRLVSYHIFNEHGKTPELLNQVLQGANVAMVSDAGMPCIADPGFLLMRSAVAAGINPVIIPGVSALTFSVAASALPSDQFTFYGFLPVKSGRRSAALKKMSRLPQTAVIFESPYRIRKLLCEIQEYFGNDTQIALTREATKVHEEILRGKVSDIVKVTAQRTWKGECVLVVDNSGLKDGISETEPENDDPAETEFEDCGSANAEP